MTLPRTAPQIGLLEVLQTSSSDVAATVAFYRDVLGATVQGDEQAESLQWARLRLGNVDIGIHAAPASYEGWLPSFRVVAVGPLRAAVLAAGLECRNYHDSPGGVSLQFRDPAGNWLAAIQFGVSAAQLAAAEA
ncbi:MAG: VOC family protein [Dehalococcoidia bacterium]|nr:VOC family protein [Dehalococcoidia bacterium]